MLKVRNAEMSQRDWFASTPARNFINIAAVERKILLYKHNTMSSANYMYWQEAQPSQRDRATLRVIEYFAKSLKVIRSDTVDCVSHY